MDDILITGQTAFDSLEEVLRRLTEAGLRALHGVVFLGHVVELHPMPSKMKAIQDAPKPKNVTELFRIANLSTTALHPVEKEHNVEPV